MWNLPGSGIEPCLLHWQVDFLPLSHRKALVFLFYLTLVQCRGNQGRGEANSINNNPHLSMFQSTCNLYVIPLNSPPSAWALLLITFYETDSEVLNDVPKVTWLQKVCMYTHTHTHTHTHTQDVCLASCKLSSISILEVVEVTATDFSSARESVPTEFYCNGLSGALSAGCCCNRG